MEDFTKIGALYAISFRGVRDVRLLVEIVITSLIIILNFIGPTT